MSWSNPWVADTDLESCGAIPWHCLEWNQGTQDFRMPRIFFCTSRRSDSCVTFVWVLQGRLLYWNLSLRSVARKHPCIHAATCEKPVTAYRRCYWLKGYVINFKSIYSIHCELVFSFNLPTEWSYNTWYNSHLSPTCVGITVPASRSTYQA